ncbi:MAG: phosphoglucosamine mutase, partial [Rhodobacteraceae bacterium]
TLGIKLHRAAVGDRYVVEAMRQKELNIGGEKSGHIVMTDYSTTGDGILAALHFLSILQGSGVKASSLLNAFQPIPQQLVNITFNSSHDPLENPDVKNLLIECESRLGKLGEMIVRKSGTEPVIRVMVQHDDEALVSSIVRKISAKIQGL